MAAARIDSATFFTLLLCGVLQGDRERGVSALTPLEFYGLRTMMQSAGMNLADLADSDQASQRVGALSGTRLSEARLITLLRRHSEIEDALERWSALDLWVVSCESETYPTRWRERLRDAAPPLLFGAGRCEMGAGGLGVVGSRNADEEALQFTTKLAELAAEQEIAIISGGARGVDQTAMLAALEANGRALGILADSLAREAPSVKYLPHVERGRLTLLSPFSPEAPFSIGNAMNRNKLIYALADACLVVSSDAETGGTWGGAIENLKRKWSPLLVREDDRAPKGNAMLIRRGGIAFDSALISRPLDLRYWFTKTPDNGERSLFDA
jgi:predicted Rossmann fold nucleotide-binding protein DprA/Smf involved in DNA uptake